MKTSLFILLFLTLIAFVPACTKMPSNWWTDEAFLKFMQDSTRIEVIFCQEYFTNKVRHPAETLEITDKDAIHSFVSQIALIPKKPCACGHFQGIIFWNDAIPLRASICSHCFDICIDRKIRCFEMPPLFYETFKQLAAKHNKKTSFDL